MRHDGALEQGVELLLDEAGQLGSSVGLRAGDEAGRMLLHQSVSVVCTKGRLLVLPADGLHARLPRL